MRAFRALAVCLLAAGVVSQGLFAEEDAVSLGTPRLSLPSAQLLPRTSAAVSYTFGGANHEGRDLQSNQFAVTVGLTDRVELAWEYDEIDANGRTAGNTFDSHAMGVQVRYGQELFGAPGALWLGYRSADGRAVTGGNLRLPPGATTVTLGAVRSAPSFGKTDLHLAGSVARSEVGDQSAWTLMGGAGLDYPITDGLTARGDLALFGEMGDVSSFEAGISGGLHYAHKCGLSADVMGTFLPSGTPLAGGPLADGSVFILDPIFRDEPIVRDLQSDALGFYMVRVGYTRDF